MVLKYKIKIVGKTPYMQHRMDDTALSKWEKGRGKIIENDGVNKEDIIKALFCSYLDEKNKNYIPSEHIRQSLICAGSYIKAKVGNSKKNISNIVAGMFTIDEEKIYDFSKDKFEIDKRSAVNHNNKARVMVIRPKWNNWSCEFTLSVDNDTITTETITDLIIYAGSYIGIGSYRPQHKGLYGRFELKEIKKIK